MTGVFAALIACNAYVFFFRGKTSLPELHRTAERHGNPGAVPAQISSRPAPTAHPLPSDPGTGIVLSRTANGQTVEQVLAELKVGRTAIAALPLALRSVVPARRATVYVALERDGSVAGIDLVDASGEGDYWRHEDGAWAPAHETRRLQTRRVVLSTTVGPSLADSLRRLGERPELAELTYGVLSGELDRPTDLSPHDRVRLLVEKQLLGGQLYRYGQLLAVEWQSPSRGIFRAFRGPDGAARGDYFGEHGENVHRDLLRSPVALGASAERVSPSEWRVAAGTPLVALGQGRIVLLTRGKVPSLTISDDSGRDITYRGSFRLAAGLGVGNELRQGQRLGAGSGGIFAIEAHRDGHLVDLQKAQPRSAPLADTSRARFGEQVSSLLAEMQAPSELASRTIVPTGN